MVKCRAVALQTMSDFTKCYLLPMLPSLGRHAYLPVFLYTVTFRCCSRYRPPDDLFAVELEANRSTLSLTSSLDCMGGQHPTLAALLPRIAQYPFYRRLGGSHGRSGRMRKISSPTGIRSPGRPARS
jgi:hypothetical protein